MLQFFATLHKELLLLLRDRGGLALLFLMPMVLVLVVSLVQNNILKATGEGSLQVLLVDNDGGEFGRRITETLRATGAVQLIDSRNGTAFTLAEARELVTDGKYQFCLVIPEGTSEAVRRGALAMARDAFGAKEAFSVSPGTASEAVELGIYFDPAVQGVFRSVLSNALQRVVLALEIEEKARRLAEVFPEEIESRLGQGLGLRPLPGTGGPQVSFNWQDEPLLAVKERIAAGEEVVFPDAVQQNVPAWTLFGMFFIVVPLSGSLIRERQEGTLQRLLTLPISALTLLGGKLAAYVLIALIQAVLMLLVGKLVLPLFGTPVLSLGDDFTALCLLILACALAATGFGILIGNLVRSYEQSTMFGSVAVVVAAALGGIMVPAYVMPKAMQAVSAWSPLAWGLNGFHELFVRHGTLREIWPNLISLLAFFAVCLAISWGLFSRRQRGGR
ncbi:ABC transporter permease [Trichloromonas sp.]|uniref:ABC transporter permease n=1 Tax=Trichloromonas sp. TaxID=3069249 RepID=UPI003D8194B6